MEKNRTTLADAFLSDHKVMTQGFHRILKALERNDLKGAVELARRLDRVAGPHIEFEEEILYPQIRRNRGRDYVSRLYREHQVALQGIQTLLQSPAGTALDPHEKEQLVGKIRTALDHAVSCGTLLSHLTTLDETRQEQILNRLRDLRSQGHRWTELWKSKE
ncbi:MAG: hemerythrin domain-containing protein [Acidobacteriota bacterium]